jgi:nucleotidyltransferase substrate binding protein (TIGR01987 family)
MSAPSPDVRWKQRFNNYCSALNQLEKFVQKKQLNELEKQGLIKAFEYTFELAWNLLKDFLTFRGAAEVFGSRDAFSEAFKLGIISDGYIWMNMIKDRSRSSHAYDQKIADELERVILENYILHYRKLKEKMETFL